MATVTCPKCKGLKKTLGLGLLEKDCERCNKTGRVTAESIEAQSATSAEKDSPKLRDDLRTLSEAYTAAQTENEELKAQIALLSANKDAPGKKAKSTGKSK